MTTGAEETGLATAAYEVAAEESCVITALAAAGGGRGAALARSWPGFAAGQQPAEVMLADGESPAVGGLPAAGPIVGFAAGADRGGADGGGADGGGGDGHALALQEWRRCRMTGT